MFLFSPPYDNIRLYKNTWNPDREGNSFFIYDITWCMYELLCDGGVGCVVVQDGTAKRSKSGSVWRWVLEAEKCGLNIFEVLIYKRPGRPGAWWSKRFRVDHEYIIIFVKGDNGPKYFSKDHMLIPAKYAGKKWSGTQRLTDGTLIKKEGIVKDRKCPGTILDYASSNTEGNKLKMNHPATMPDKLAEDMIQCFTSGGDLIIDPFCGSGTTLVAAEKLGRKYIGIDNNSYYCSLSKERIESETKIKGGQNV